MSKQDDLEGILASAMDLANTYAREHGVTEGRNYNTSHDVRDTFERVIYALLNRCRKAEERAAFATDLEGEGVGMKCEICGEELRMDDPGQWYSMKAHEARCYADALVRAREEGASEQEIRTLEAKLESARYVGD